MRHLVLLVCSLLLASNALSQPGEPYEVTITVRFYEASRDLGAGVVFSPDFDEAAALSESLREDATQIDIFRTSFLAHRGVPFTHQAKHTGVMELSMFKVTGTLDNFVPRWPTQAPWVAIEDFLLERRLEGYGAGRQSAAQQLVRLDGEEQKIGATEGNTLNGTVLSMFHTETTIKVEKAE